MSDITQDRLRELFDYRDGNLYCKVARHKCNIGDLVGYIRADGYRVISVDGKICYVHRLIFLYHHGFLPKFLDHIDCNPSNNNINNLREATHSQNQWNRGKYKPTKSNIMPSEYKGVCWYKQTKKWRAQIRINCKRKHLGYFTSEIEAAKAYDKCAITAFGEFAKINFDTIEELFL